MAPNSVFSVFTRYVQHSMIQKDLRTIVPDSTSAASSGILLVNERFIATGDQELKTRLVSDVWGECLPGARPAHARRAAFV